ncbi:TPA: ABC-three component system protein [Photobacterium damselae]
MFGSKQEQKVEGNGTALQVGGDFHLSITKNEYKKYHNLSCVPDLDIVFDSNSLRIVVEQCYEQFTDNHELKTSPLDKTSISLDKKHILNNFSPIFWNECIAFDFEYQFNEFEEFLNIRENFDLLWKLEETAKSLNMEILSKRSRFGDKEFQEIIQDLGNTLVESQYEALQGKVDTIRLVLYYLYSRCLLGRKTEDEKNVIPK